MEREGSHCHQGQEITSQRGFWGHPFSTLLLYSDLALHCSPKGEGKRVWSHFKMDCAFPAAACLLISNPKSLYYHYGHLSNALHWVHDHSSVKKIALRCCTWWQLMGKKCLAVFFPPCCGPATLTYRGAFWSRESSWSLRSWWSLGCDTSRKQCIRRHHLLQLQT